MHLKSFQPELRCLKVQMLKGNKIGNKKGGLRGKGEELSTSMILCDLTRVIEFSQYPTDNYFGGNKNH